jgi:hypothetical protein
MPGLAYGHGSQRRRRRKWAHSPLAPARLGGGQRGGGAFLPDVFGDARQYLEAAFGADLTADPATWSWTDITRYVQWDPGVDINIGYPDEALAIVPAVITCELLNTQDNGGDFTLGNPLGAYWPNIRENTPIRGRLDVGSGPTDRFFGYATSWAPFWDAGRELALVKLQAHGISRRLRQGKSANQSAMWRFNMLAHKYPTDTNGGGDFGIGQGEFRNSGQGYHAPPAHYWPLEDRSGALQGTNAAVPAYPLRAASADALPAFASRTVGQGSGPIAVFGTGDTLSVTVPPVAPGADVTGLFPGVSTIIVPFLMHLPEVPGAAVEMLRITTTGSMARVSLGLDFIAPGVVSVSATAYDSSGGTLGTMVLFNDMLILDTPTWMMLRIDQNGADILVETDYSVHSPSLYVGDAVATTSFNTFTISSRTVGSVVGLSVAPSGDLPDIAIGHLGIYNGGLGATPSTRPRAILGRRGDTPDIRLIRTCLENDVPLELVGTSDTLMGPQVNGNFLDIVGECQAADNGVLLDGLSSGLTFICRTEAYSRAPSLTLDADDGMISGPLAPVHNDQGRVNTFTARNPYGLEATFTKSDGDLGTDTVGVYDDSADVPVALDSALYDVAAWKVAQGTVGGLRYPRLSFQLAKASTSTRAQQWLDSRPFGRVDVLALEPAAPDPDRAFLLRGWHERWNSKLWSVTANVSDYRTWAVTVLAEDSGDDSEFLGWLETDGTTVQTGIAAGATSVTVDVTGPIWTNATTPSPNYADDLTGLYINLDGLRVGVTAVTGSVSPQTFTIVGADVLRAVPPGAPVSVWDPVVIGL